jgi:hypothetical protein
MVSFPEAPVALEAFQEVDRSRGRDTVVSARHILYVCNFYKLYEKYGGDLVLLCGFGLQERPLAVTQAAPSNTCLPAQAPGAPPGP